MRCLIQCLGDPVDTHGSAEAVCVAHPVPHDIYFILNGYDLLKSMSLNPGLNPCTLLYLLTLAAVISDILRHLHYRLVSPSAQCNINGVAGKFIVLRIA